MVSYANIKEKLEDAREALSEVMRYVEEALEYDDHEELRRFLDADPEMKELYVNIQELREEIGNRWTPALQERLKEEERWNDHEEAEADRGSY